VKPRERRVYPFAKLNTPRLITITPVKARNFLSHSPLSIAVTMPIERRPGIVPIAKNARTRAPVIRLPVLIAYICIASVNPHGRKKVATPVIMVDVLEFPVPLMFFPRNFGSVGEKFPIRGERFVRFNPRISIITPTRVVIIQRKIFEKCMIEPKKPRRPQRIPNPRTRPR